jgi:hypothetical protein
VSSVVRNVVAVLGVLGALAVPEIARDKLKTGLEITAPQPILLT